MKRPTPLSPARLFASGFLLLAPAGLVLASVGRGEWGLLLVAAILLGFLQAVLLVVFSRPLLGRASTGPMARALARPWMLLAAWNLVVPLLGGALRATYDATRPPEPTHRNADVLASLRK